VKSGTHRTATVRERTGGGIKVTADGRPVDVPEGSMLSAAVAIAGGYRRSVTGERRGAL
jgi:hypothetical protein